MKNNEAITYVLKGSLRQLLNEIKIKEDLCTIRHLQGKLYVYTYLYYIDTYTQIHICLKMQNKHLCTNMQEPGTNDICQEKNQVAGGQGQYRDFLIYTLLQLYRSSINQLEVHLSTQIIKHVELLCQALGIQWNLSLKRDN